ncbi:hypothetical protein Hanom_Chr00s000002g01600891 [Helianthus anomalus]
MLGVDVLGTGGVGLGPKKGHGSVGTATGPPPETPIIQIAVDDPKLRKILYRSSYNFIPDRRCSLADHPILKFEPSTPEWNKYDKLKNIDLLQHRVIDWLWLSEIGSNQEVADILCPKLVDALELTFGIRELQQARIVS